MSDLRETVTDILNDTITADPDYSLYGVREAADAAITAVIESMATEAIEEARQDRIKDGLDPDGSTIGGLFIPANGGMLLTRYDMADWLRAHIGRTEATDTPHDDGTMLHGRSLLRWETMLHTFDDPDFRGLRFEMNDAGWETATVGYRDGDATTP